MNATIRLLRFLASRHQDSTEAERPYRNSHASCGRFEVPARHRLAICSMFALFACAYFTLDRLPGSAVSTLRGGIEFVARSETSPMADQVL